MSAHPLSYLWLTPTCCQHSAPPCKNKFARFENSSYFCILKTQQFKVQMNKQMKRITRIAAIILFMVPMIATAQKTEDTPATNYTRGKGFFVRPEFCNGLLANVGYQLNPYVQLSGNIGAALGNENSPIALVATVGIRTYFSDTPWTAFFDYHAGSEYDMKYLVFRQTVNVGASYKDLDFGAGIIWGTDGYVSGMGLSLTIGYNFRFYKHK